MPRRLRKRSFQPQRGHPESKFQKYYNKYEREGDQVFNETRGLWFNEQMDRTGRIPTMPEMHAAMKKDFPTWTDEYKKTDMLVRMADRKIQKKRQKRKAAKARTNKKNFVKYPNTNFIQYKRSSSPDWKHPDDEDSKTVIGSTSRAMSWDSANSRGTSQGSRRPLQNPHGRSRTYGRSASRSRSNARRRAKAYKRFGPKWRN